MVYDIERLSGWEKDLLTTMRGITRGVPGGGSELNRRVVDNLHARYVYLISSGWELPRYDTPRGDSAAVSMVKRLSEETGLNHALVRAFLVSLYTLAKAGKIPEVKYDPLGAKSRQELRASVDPSIWRKAQGAVGKVAGLGVVLIVLAGIGVGMYFLRKR